MIVFELGPIRLLNCDVLDGLRTLQDESVQCCVTSPPYWGLRDYGCGGQIGLEKTPAEYVARIVAVFAEVRRVLRRDGTLWLNMGDGYTSGGRAEWRSSVGDNKGHLVLDDASHRPPTPPAMKPKDLIGMPWELAFALRADGWWLRSEIIWHKPNCMPESVTDRPTKAHEQIFLLTKSASYWYDAEAVVEQSTKSIDSICGAKFYRDATRQTQGRNGLNGSTLGPGRERGRNLRSVWTIATQPYPEAHFATFPEEIASRCIRAGTAKHEPQLVLDPFAGSGTTLAVARRLGHRGVGCELNTAYCELAKKRITAEEQSLLEAVAT